jgi:hypothetical protein
MSSCSASVSPAVQSSPRRRPDSPRPSAAGRILRSILLPSFAAVLSIGAVYGALAVPSALYGTEGGQLPSSGRMQRLTIAPPAAAPQMASLGPSPAQSMAAGAEPRCLEDCGAGSKTSRLPEADMARKGARLAASSSARFEAIAGRAALSPDKVAGIFRKAGLKSAPARIAVATTGLPEAVLRRMEHAAPVHDTASLVLAYANTEQGRAARALDVLSDAEGYDRFGLPDEGAEDDSVLLVPDFEDTPDDTPVPLRRPRFEPAEKPAPRATREERDDDRQPEKPAARKRLAYAKPDSPEPKNGGIFDRWRGGKRAGKGVAVYDISAARVYMPDGSVLEAHSGIGKMADNPKYAHVKMNGPTPPHTYNLRMREKRFHGVEAIRMLPVDGKNKHGRDGFLTHSYLLRGGRAESHGCVAFKNYDKFLKAFKQGKVTQLVVVPSGGKAAAVQVASR